MNLFNALQRALKQPSTMVDAVGTTTFSHTGTPYLPSAISLPNYATITNSYDPLTRLTQTSLNNFWGHTLDGYGYTLDPLGLRTNILRNLGLTNSTVDVGYDNIGQLTSWNAAEGSGTLRQNEQLAFGFDAADNLHSRTNGNLSQTFTVDAANELTNVSRGGTFTLSGATPAPMTSVTVNGQSAQTYGDFTFARTNLSLTNGQNTFTIVAQNVYGTNATNILTVNLPTNVVLAFDNNGNVTNDGTRGFGYNTENQLTNVSVAGQWQASFVYDGLGRRRIARDYSWNGSGWALTNEVHYIYDGYLPVQERYANNNVLVTYTRGLDLSGDLWGAGGVGGLLARTDTNGSTFYHSDGAGNVMALMDSQQNIAARYLYNPFGKPLGQWGSMASVNEMQFSSMPHDNLSGLSLYPFRAYEPNFQRCLNHDPIGELGFESIRHRKANPLAGGPNLYEFGGNNPVNWIDPLGLQVPPQVIEVLESPEAQELEEVVEADIEVAAKATEVEAESIWSKTVDFFSKAKQTQLNQGIGRSAENATCPLKNTTRIPSLNNTANYRVPDLLDTVNKIIGDTKNVQYQAMTPQLQDFIDWAGANNYTFQLTVSTSTTLSSSVINAVPNIVMAPLP